MRKSRGVNFDVHQVSRLKCVAMPSSCSSIRMNRGVHLLFRCDLICHHLFPILWHVSLDWPSLDHYSNFLYWYEHRPVCVELNANRWFFRLAPNHFHLWSNASFCSQTICLHNHEDYVVWPVDHVAQNCRVVWDLLRPCCLGASKCWCRSLNDENHRLNCHACWSIWNQSYLFEIERCHCYHDAISVWTHRCRDDSIWLRVMLAVLAMKCHYFRAAIDVWNRNCLDGPMAVALVSIHVTSMEMPMDAPNHGTCSDSMSIASWFLTTYTHRAGGRITIEIVSIDGRIEIEKNVSSQIEFNHHWANQEEWIKHYLSASALSDEERRRCTDELP